MSEADKSKKQSNLKVKSWYSNRYQIVVVQRNILFLLTLISMLSVAVAVIFVKNILASKSLEPYVIEVEEKTGIATTVDQLTSQHFTADIMVRKYFLNQFVHAASGYDSKTYSADVTKVRLFAAPAVYSDFRRRIRSRDLGNTSQIDVRIKSIQFPNNNTARVRILKQISKADTPTVNKDEVIDITFYFADLNLTMEERLINPLGFQVSKYLIAEEEFKY